MYIFIAINPNIYKMIIGVTGYLCAGKDTIGDYLKKEKNFIHISLSDFIKEELEERNMDTSRENFRNHANKQRENHGNGYFAKKAVEKIDNSQNYVVTSIRHPSEIEALRENKLFRMLFVDADQKTRHERLLKRNDHKDEESKSFEKFKENEKKEENKEGSGQQLSKCKEMSDIMISNDSTFEELYKNLDEIVNAVAIDILKEKRPLREEYYMQIAKTVSIKSNCLSTHFGAIIVKDDQICSTGYNGAPRKTDDCIERGFCLRRKLNIPSGERYEICRSVHAEQNAIINAARAGSPILGGDLYLYGKRVFNGTEKEIDSYPCYICKKMIINSGISRVICSTSEGKIAIYSVEDWVEEWNKKDVLDDEKKYTGNYSCKNC